VAAEKKAAPKSKRKAALRKISGCVRDIQATPIEGVEVSSDMTDVKVYTDKKGNYTIEVPAESNLTFLKSGYSRYSKYIKDSDTVNVQIVRE